MVRGWGAPVPDALIHVFGIGHAPIGSTLICVPIAYAFAPVARRGVLVWLLAGTVLHYALDVLQDHHGQGYPLLYPLSLRTFELGLIGPEATVPLAPWLLLLTAAAWAARWALQRRRARMRG
jgi:membrane-bound metal-dependent hydrolase YbcI (DUF457 family)